MSWGPAIGFILLGFVFGVVVVAAILSEVLLLRGEEARPEPPRAPERLETPETGLLMPGALVLTSEEIEPGAIELLTSRGFERLAGVHPDVVRRALQR